MKKNLKIALYVIGGLTLSLGGFALYKKTKSNKKDKGGANTAGSGETNTNVDDTIVGNGVGFTPKFPLQNGSEGITVYIVQSALIKLGQNISLTGKWNKETYDAVDDANIWVFGFGTICNFGGGCPFASNNYEKLLKKAVEVGFNFDETLVKAKLFFK